MTRPLSVNELIIPAQFVRSSDGMQVDLMSTMHRNDVVFYRHPNGGGYVAETSYVPLEVRIPWDVTVFEETYVHADADLVSAGTRICGLVERVSRPMRDEDHHLLMVAKRQRDVWWQHWMSPHR